MSHRLTNLQPLQPRNHFVGALLVLALGANVLAAGFASSDNFMVFTKANPSQEGAKVLAADVLRKAEQYRREIAEEWLGEQLPPGVGSTVISVSLSDVKDKGLTWAKDYRDAKFHNIYLVTNRERAVGETLAHEIAHIVLATQFAHPHRLSPWVEEGIASRYDDRERLAKRERIVRWYSKSGNWPQLATVLDARKIGVTDREAYATAASLTSFLVSKGGKAKFLKFAHAGQAKGWSSALAGHYGFQDATQLQKAWQQWVGANSATTASLTPRSRH